MAVTWRAAVLEQAELVSDRLRQLASSGLLFLHNEFGLDLGLNPELWPCWVVLSVALVGILVAVWGVAACGGAARRRRGAAPREKDTSSSTTTTTTTLTGTDSTKTPLARTARSEEPKKKNKKKPGEKKAQPNGRPVPEPPEPREEVKVTHEVPKQTAGPPQQPPDIKADKAKKSKKKPKPEVKQSQSVSTSDGKEPDEGSWETKISNREKRQQRKKEKGASDDSGSPGGGDHAGQQTEQPVVKAPVNTKKNKVESLNVKAEKRDAIITPAPSSWNPAKSVNSGGWAEMTMKAPPQVNSAESDKWSVGLKTPGHRNSEPLAWGQDSNGSWTGIDGRIKKELNTVNFSVLGLKSSAGDPVTQSAADLGKWDGLPAVNNEWSGINGLGAVDPSSDWNAPTELWGNYEEPNMVTPAAQEAPVSQLHRLQDSDDEKEKGDSSASSKSKRKKKKKKKPEDENAVPQVNTEGLSAPAESSNIKPQPHVPQEEPAKQNLMPSASQKKTDQNWEQPKQVQKKKARRET